MQAIAVARSIFTEVAEVAAEIIEDQTTPLEPGAAPECLLLTSSSSQAARTISTSKTLGRKISGDTRRILPSGTRTRRCLGRPLRCWWQGFPRPMRGWRCRIASCAGELNGRTEMAPHCKKSAGASDGLSRTRALPVRVRVDE